MEVNLSNGKVIPMEMHKIKIVQQTFLPAIEERIEAIQSAVSIHSFSKATTFFWTC